MIRKLLVLFTFLIYVLCFSQPISLYQQFYGRYDFTMIGNTMNLGPNGVSATCEILTTSSETLNLAANQSFIAAYLYWSGSGSLNQADLNVKLNNIEIVAQRTFETNMGGQFSFFSAFADVTNQVQLTGNGVYTLSDLDLTNIIAPYCPTGVNYAGWSILVVYEDQSLPNNIVSIYDGFEIVSTSVNPNISFTLGSLNVVNPLGAKIGFLVWEGDENITVTEELHINGNLISNLPLNPGNNVFNSTNSFTNATNLWNMDLDYFDISQYVQVGDTSLTFSIKTGQDTVIPNCFVLSLNSELADASVKINNVTLECDSQEILIDYTIFNLSEFIDLPSNIPVSFYANNVLVGNIVTNSAIPKLSSLTESIDLTIPNSVGNNFTLKVLVDDDGNGNGIVTETDEENNVDTKEISLMKTPIVNALDNIKLCDEDENGYEIIDLTLNEFNISSDVLVTYYNSEEDAISKINNISNPSNYTAIDLTNQTIWVRYEDKESKCYVIYSFSVLVQRKALANIHQPIKICNKKNNRNQFNLDMILWDISNNYSFLNQLNIAYYETMKDALDDTNPIVTNKYSTTQLPKTIYLKAKGKSELWCEKILEIILNDCSVPKGISPNGDGFNDNLDLEAFSLLDLKIYNRFGNEVFKYGIGYTNQWNGQDVNGNELPAGSYFYTFKTLYETYTGYIYIIREVK